MARLPIPWSNYDSTRVPSSEQRTVNLYPHSKRGYRQYPGLTEFASKTDATPTNAFVTQTYISGTNPRAPRFKSDGTKLFWVSVNQIHETTLSVGYAIQTAGAVTSTSLPYTSPTANGLCFNPGGTKAFILDYTDALIYRHSLTAWDSTTISEDSGNTLDISPAIPGGTTGELSIDINSDGTRIYVMTADSISGDVKVHQFDLSTAYDLTTGVYTNKFLLVGAGSVGPSGGGIKINSDDSRLFVVNPSQDTVREYYLYDTSDVSSGVEVSSYDASAQDNQFQGGITIAEPMSGFSYMYLVDGTNLYGYSTSLDGFTLGGASQIARGMEVMDGVLYVVFNRTLYSVNSEGTLTAISGTIAGTDFVVMETDGVQLVITTGGTIYVYTVAGGLVTVTDGDIDDTAKSSAYLDLAFYFDQPDGKLIASANNDATSFSTDDILEAEAFADDIIRMYAHNQLLYAFGETSTEVYYTSGVGRPPIERQQVIERGIIGTHAITSLDDVIYLIDQDRNFGVMSGLEYRKIASPGVAEAWADYELASDVFVKSYTYRQQIFIQCTFPSAGDAWTYHVESGTWSERQDPNGSIYEAFDFANVYRKALALDNSKIWELSETVYQDNGSNVTRTKDTGLVTTEIFGEASIYGEEMICNSLKITTESTAVATLTVTLSKDGGAFAQSRTMTLAAGVQTRELTAWGKFREGIWRITTTSNAGVDIIDISADLEILRG